MEWILTFNFVLVVIGLIDEDNRKINLAGLGIGMIVACGILAGVSIGRGLAMISQHKMHCILHCTIHCTMQEINDFLHYTVYCTV